MQPTENNVPTLVGDRKRAALEYLTVECKRAITPPLKMRPFGIYALSYH